MPKKKKSPKKCPDCGHVTITVDGKCLWCFIHAQPGSAMACFGTTFKEPDPFGLFFLNNGPLDYKSSFDQVKASLTNPIEAFMESILGYKIAPYQKKIMELMDKKTKVRTNIFEMTDVDIVLDFGFRHWERI
jgi:hypothetical protein